MGIFPPVRDGPLQSQQITDPGCSLFLVGPGTSRWQNGQHWPR